MSSFIVGGNGKVYEGRGWNVNPQKMPEFENLDRKSLDIAYIGRDKRDISFKMRTAKTSLIKLGIMEWFIDEDYNLVEAKSENVQEQFGIALGKIKKKITDINKPRIQISSGLIKRIIDETLEGKEEQEMKCDDETKDKGDYADSTVVNDVQEKNASLPQQQRKKPKKLSKKLRLLQEKLKEIGATIECDPGDECLNPKKTKKWDKSPYMAAVKEEEGEEPVRKRIRNKELKKRLKFERILAQRLSYTK